MKKLKRLLVGLIMLWLIPLPIIAQEYKKFDFENETYGEDSKTFSSIVGFWRIQKDGPNFIYAVDGGKWKQGSLSAGIEEKVKALYSERSVEFLKGLAAYRAFPLSICKEYPSFKGGILSVSFKPVSGKEDQAAGIAFNIKPSGEYLAVRANALENNLVLFKFENGKRLSLQSVENVPTSSNQWHMLKIVINGKKIEGYLNDKKYVNYTHVETIDGKIGLWSKADSYVFFDNFTVQSM